MEEGRRLDQENEELMNVNGEVQSITANDEFADLRIVLFVLSCSVLKQVQSNEGLSRSIFVDSGVKGLISLVCVYFEDELELLLYF